MLLVRSIAASFFVCWLVFCCMSFIFITSRVHSIVFHSDASRCTNYLLALITNKSHEPFAHFYYVFAPAISGFNIFTLYRCICVYALCTFFIHIFFSQPFWPCFTVLYLPYRLFKLQFIFVPCHGKYKSIHTSTVFHVFSMRSDGLIYSRRMCKQRYFDYDLHLTDTRSVMNRKVCGAPSNRRTLSDMCWPVLT